MNQKRLKELLRYDPDTGEFTWRVSFANGRKVGTVAGTRTKRGRIQIKINRKIYFGHNLAWLYMTGDWPEHFVDHRDTDESNNRWENLRAATEKQNNANRKVHRDNKLGVKGVRPEGSKYRADIGKDGKTIYLGRFDTIAEAAQKYAEEAIKLHGEFARV